MTIYRSVLLTIGNGLDQINNENKTHVLYNNLFAQDRAVYEMWKPVMPDRNITRRNALYMLITKATNTLKIFSLILIACEGEAIPLQALTCPEGSRRLRLPDFKTIGT
jgi:hypothetical protein